MAPSRERELEIYRGNARLDTRASKRPALLRLFTDWGFLVRTARYALGLPVPMETEDRRVLEQILFPYFGSQSDVRTVLFVGCDWYTKHYQRVFFRAQTFWTIDPAPGAARFGARQHLIAPLENLEEHFAPAHFDLILCNGVYGFGLDSQEQCERAFQACHSRLRTQGHLVLGWDDIPERTPVPLAGIAALQQFQRWDFPPLGTWRYLTDTPYRHTYDFYRR
ncbi:MAG TPA: class I SAM-dependent methyltransferase [Steroidobacteraceae bacterium]|nr:class I SAM-dependent methyltransferase [Steroidobacteraceae bacterium]